jgi:hypothetical protein
LWSDGTKQHRSGQPFWFWGTTALLLVLGATWPVDGIEVLSDERCLLFLPLGEGERLELTWRHSVDHILVRDIFTRRRDALHLLASYSPYFAAGLGEIPGRGRVVAAAEHGLAIVDINERIERLPLRVGSVEVAHTLYHRGRAYNLSARYAHCAVELRVARRAWLLWRSACPRELPPL